MRILIIILLMTISSVAQKRFHAEHFIEKYQLSLPQLPKRFLNVNLLTHASDTWNYYYVTNQARLDSVVRYLKIQGFPESRRLEEYDYSGDTTKVSQVSVALSGGDTLNNWRLSFTNGYRTKNALDLKTNCIWRTSFDKRGIKILEDRKCPNDEAFRGQVYHLVQREEYLDKYKEKNGVIDSSTFRRYYLTPFDSVVADFMVKEGKDPFIVRLNVYGENNRKTMSYGFGIYTRNFEVVEMDTYTYTDQEKLHRVYHFEVKDGDPNLVNYTEYEYDKLGRKVRVTTRVKPEKEKSRETGRQKGGK